MIYPPAAPNGRANSKPNVSVVMPVYRDLERARQSISMLKEQILDEGDAFEIVVIDDGSSDGTADALDMAFGADINLIRMALNQGRTKARSVGVEHARGEHVVFIDSDCVPAHEYYLALHIAALKKGAIASCGPIVGYGGGFWDRYQREASSRRETLLAQGFSGAGSTANMAFTKSAFLAIGGFDICYKYYGFEDRDLLARLANEGKIVWIREAIVSHIDNLSMADVSRKMIEAGHYNSRLFSDTHTATYRALGYADIDVRKRPWLAGIALAMGWALPLLVKATDTLIASRYVPFPLRSGLVKSVSALSFLIGTRRSAVNA